jgi:hypothetical protein
VLHIKIPEGLFDLAGAKGHNDSRSALTMTQDVWESYRVAGDILEAVKDSTLSHREGYDRFLDTRGRRLERKGFRRLKIEDLEECSLLRLLTMGRVTELKVARLFENAFDNLRGTSKARLVDGLSVDGVEDGTAAVPYYLGNLF